MGIKAMKSIDKVKQISTKKGDSGQSKNYVNETLSKSDTLFDVLGDIDELSSQLGVTYHHTEIFKEEIKKVQLKLQHIMSVIATPRGVNKTKVLSNISEDDLMYLEKLEEEILKTAKIKAEFVLTGSDSTYESALLDLSRSIVRRAERQLVRYYEETKREELRLPQRYLNRLSDLLFIMARSIK